MLDTFRLTLWYSGFWVLVLIALGWFVYGYLEDTVQKYEMYEEEDELIEDLIEDALDDLEEALWISLPLALILSALGGWLIATASLRPVDRLTAAARKITGQSLSIRLPQPRQEDEIGRLAKALNEMIGRLEAAVEEAKRFSADASHELRTPLTIIQGEIEVTLQGSRSQEECERTLVSTLEEIRGLRRIVENLLILSRADSGELQISKEPFPVEQLVRETVEEARMLADTKTQTLNLEACESAEIAGDRRWIKHLLLNLLDNAVTHCPEQATIAVRVYAEDGSICLEVSDDGPGIPPGERERVFDRFYRRKTGPGEAGKCGLGLAISRWIAEAHGGRIELLETPGGGTTVHVRFPAA